MSPKLYFYYVSIVFLGFVAFASLLGWVMPCGAGQNMCGPEWPFPVALFISLFLFGFMINQINKLKKEIKQSEDVEN